MSLATLTGNTEVGLPVRQKINNAIIRLGEAVLVKTTDELNSLTYTDNQLWSVSSGDYVETINGGFRYQILGASAPDFDLQNPNGVRMNVLRNASGEYNFRAMLPAANGTTDDYAKMARLLNKEATDGVPPVIYIPPGRYYMGQTLNLKSPLTIKGDHAAFQADTLCELIFPASTAGIIVNRFNTLNADTVSAGGAADGAQIIGIRLTGGRGLAFDETKSGIWMRARARIQNVTTYGFAGHGVYAGAGSDGNPYLGNCNLFWVEFLYTELNRGNGFHAEGTDANAGNVFHVNAKNNDGWGVYEDSFLNNTHIGHHALDNDLGSFFAANQSVLIGAYAEDGNGDNAQWNGTMIGCMINDFSAGLGQKLQTEQANGPRALRNDMGGFRGTRSTHTTDIASENDNILSSRHTTTGISYPLRFMWDTSGVGAFIRYASSSTRLINFNSSTTTATYGRSTAVGESTNIPNLFLGLNNAARFMSFSSAAPTSGEWARGDIVFNNAPSAGGKIGWVCTAGGTPGTWKPWGAIDP